MNATPEISEAKTGQLVGQKVPQLPEDFGTMRVPVVRNRRATWKGVLLGGILGSVIGGVGTWWFLENFYELIHPIIVKMVM